MEFWLWH